MVRRYARGVPRREGSLPVVSGYLTGMAGVPWRPGATCQGASVTPLTVLTFRDLRDARQAAQEVAGDTAVHDEIVTVDVARVGPEQERDDVRHVLRRGHAPDRDQRVALGGDGLVLVDLRGHAGAHHAGREAVDADAVGPELLGEDRDEHDQRGLARPVGAE